MPVSASAISRSVGYPAKPIRYRIRPSHQRLRLVSGTLIELQPSKATVHSPPNRTPGVQGWASGPATTSNSALTGAGPSRRRKSRSAFSEGDGRSRPASPAVSLTQTRAYPSRGYIPIASRKYTPTRDGRSRSRRCTVLVCSRMSSTSSNGRYCVNSPRWPGANTPAATVTARVIVVVAH